MQCTARYQVGVWIRLLGLIFPLLFELQGVGQTESQISTHLKKIVVFEIRPGIDVFPVFSADGNVCRMVIEKRGYSTEKPDFDIIIPTALANQLVDEVVPPSERGNPSKFLSPDSYIAGGASLIKQDYANVSVSMYGSSVEGKVRGARAIIIEWPKRTCASM